MTSPNISLTTLTLATFVHSSLLWAWSPVNIPADQDPVPSGLKPLYQDQASPIENYSIYFNQERRQLLLRVSPAMQGMNEEVYYQTLPEYIHSVTASVLKDSRLYIAGERTDERWFVSAFNLLGEILWTHQGSDDDATGIPKKIHFYKLEETHAGVELLASGIAYDTNIYLLFNSSDGELQLESLGIAKRRTLNVRMDSNNATSVSESEEKFEERAFRTLEWVTGILTVIGGVTLIGALYAGYKFISDTNMRYLKYKDDLNRKEKDRRSKESRKLDDLFRYKPRGFLVTGDLMSPTQVDTSTEVVTQNQNHVQYSSINLFSAVYEGNVPLAEEILQADDSLAYETDDNGNSILHMSIDHVDMTNWLLTEYPDLVGSTNNHGVTALHAASLHGNINVLKLLLKESRKIINQQDSLGFTSLHFAVHEGHLEVVHLLLAEGANPDIISNDGFSALELAAKTDNAKVVDLILTWKPSLEKDEASLLFHSAAVTGSCSILNQLTRRSLDKHFRFEKLVGRKYLTSFLEGACQSALSEGGLTILHVAVINNNIEAVNFILEHRLVSVNAVDDSGNTALHLAAMNGNLEVVRTLLSRRAAVNIQNSLGFSALHRALLRHTQLHRTRQIEQDELVLLLLRSGANYQMRCREGRTPLHMAALSGYINAINIIS